MNFPKKHKIKKLLAFGILLLVLGATFIPIVSSAQEKTLNPLAVLLGKGTFGFEANHLSPANAILSVLFTGISQLLMTASSFALIFSGMIFDWVMKFTVVDMGAKIGNTDLGSGISLAWATLRDIANMLFIFVLLFAAFRTMFDTNFGNFGKTIKDIIIIALLINFSLFFSKVVIDASNIVSIGFYKSITSSNTASLTNSHYAIGSVGNFKGISGGYMNMLGMQSLYSSNILNGNIKDPIQILVIGFMSAIFMLITAVILLIAGIMFATRFIILVFIMVLSPLAFIAYIMPGQKSLFDKWRSALIDQSFFAPIYLALTWVVFRLGTSLLSTIKDDPNLGPQKDFASMFSNPGSAIALIVNYVLIIGFSIAALIISKQMASKTAGFKQVSGGIGAAVVGGTAWAGRQTIGRTGKYFSENASLQKAAKERTGFVGAASRLGLYASKQARSGTFDARNATIPTNVVGDMIEGTAGRTKIGKKLGLNDVNIPGVAMSSIVKDMDMLGKGGEKGYKETKEESEKRVRDREAKAASELSIAQAKKDIMEGTKSGVAPGTPAYDAMEKAITKLSDKETETLVANNRELLQSLNFANAISVKQLEAINKSDQFSDDEKGQLKINRFKEIEEIDDASGIAALAIPVTARTPDQAAAAARVEKARTRVKGLADSELEMMSPNYFDPTRPEGKEFISQLKGSQVDTINKSSKFSSTQKEDVKKERLRPLLDALTAGNVATSQSIVRKADIKTKVGFMKPTGTPPVIIALHPDILPIYTPKMLQRMAAHDDMSDDDIHNLRLALLGPTGTGAPGVPTGTINWLNDPNKGAIEFP